MLCLNEAGKLTRCRLELPVLGPRVLDRRGQRLFGIDEIIRAEVRLRERRVVPVRRSLLRRLHLRGDQLRPDITRGVETLCRGRPRVGGRHRVAELEAAKEVCLLYTSDAADERSSVD